MRTLAPSGASSEHMLNLLQSALQLLQLMTWVGRTANAVACLSLDHRQATLTQMTGRLTILARIFWVYVSLALLARTFVAIDSQTSQGQDECQGPKRNVWDIILRHHLFLTHAFIVTVQSPLNPHCRILHRSRLFHLPWKPSRTR